MGPEKEKEQEMVGSFNSMNISSLPTITDKEISTNTIKESMKTQQVQSISLDTPQNSKQGFTTSPVQYDPSRIAEYILNALPETPGEDDIFESYLKNREQTTTCNNEERLSDFGIIESNSSSHPMKKNGGGQSSNNRYISQIAAASGQQLISQKRSKTPSGYFGTSDPVIISDEDEERNVRRVSKSTKHSSNNSNSNEDEESYDGTQDHAWITEKERMVKLYSHKLHLRKPRMQDPNLCSHEIEFLSDFDDDDL